MGIVALLAFLIITVVHAAGPYKPDWTSLDTRPLPSWFDDAKFGIFIHWGVYAVPSWAPVGTYAEWYWHDLNQPGSATQKFHNSTYGSGFQYQDFVKDFRAELFDADAWAQLIASSGAKYVVPTSKHHEGFTLWPSPQSWNWNSVDAGPHKDLLGLILTAARKAGLHAGLYFSLYEWYHPLYIGPDPSQYVSQVMIPQLYDLVNKYKPELLWADGNWEHPSDFWKTPDFIAWLYNDSPVKDTVVINDRWGSETPGAHGGYYTPEYSDTVYANKKWEENSGIDIHSYGLNRNTPAALYNSAYDLIKLLVRSVAFGGNLLLDIGPAADGSIPTIMQERLTSMGEWLGVNGEAIYSTRKWRAQQDVVLSNPVQFSTVINNSDNVWGQVCPKCNTSTITFGGNTNTNDQCQALCAKATNCLSYVWHTGSSSNGAYALNCYLRSDDVWAPVVNQPEHVSGRKDHYTEFYTSKTVANATAVYAIFTTWPDNSVINLPTPSPTAQTVVTFLGVAKQLIWHGQVGKAGISVELPIFTPGNLPCFYAWTLKLTNVV